MSELDQRLAEWRAATDGLAAPNHLVKSVRRQGARSRRPGLRLERLAAMIAAIAGAAFTAGWLTSPHPAPTVVVEAPPAAPAAETRITTNNTSVQVQVNAPRVAPSYPPLPREPRAEASSPPIVELPIPAPTGPVKTTYGSSVDQKREDAKERFRTGNLEAALSEFQECGNEGDRRCGLYAGDLQTIKVALNGRANLDSAEGRTRMMSVLSSEKFILGDRHSTVTAKARQAMAQRSLALAAAAERSGQWAAALRHAVAAQTMEPDSPAVRAAVQRLESRPAELLAQARVAGSRELYEQVLALTPEESAIHQYAQSWLDAAPKP